MTRLLPFLSVLFLAGRIHAHELAATPISWLSALSHPLDHLPAAAALVTGVTILFVLGARRSSIALAVIGTLALVIV